MVNNLDRIFEEIKKESHRLAPDHNIDPEELLELTMQIVNLEDENAIKKIPINKMIKGEITKMVNRMGLEVVDSC